MLKKNLRLTKKDNISRIIRDGRRFSGKFFLVKTLPNELSHSRVTVITSKKVEKKAVKRNKCRRRIYEAIRHNIETLGKDGKCFDIAILTNKNCIDAPYSEIEKEIKNIGL